MTLQLILQCTITDEAAYAELANDLPNHVENNEPGTLDYRWLRSDNSVIFIDQYADANAFAVHFNGINQAGFVDRLMACMRIDAVHACGDTNETVDAILTQFGAKIYTQVAGFTRGLTATA